MCSKSLILIDFYLFTISTYLQITFDTVLYSLVVTQAVSRALFSVGVINTWGAYTTDVREANLRSCVCL